MVMLLVRIFSISLPIELRTVLRNTVFLGVVPYQTMSVVIESL